MKNLAGNKKALSPVFTTVLLILVVTMGMSLAMAYFVNYVTDFQTGRGSSIMELVAIEDVWFQSNQTVKMALYNYGKVQVKLDSVYLDGRPVDFTAESVEIGVGGLGSVRLNPSSAFRNSTSYHFKLITSRGSTFEGDYVSPGGW